MVLSEAIKNDILDKRHLMRHFDLIDFDKLNTPITVIGAGGIGSWTTFALAKMGFSSITVYDSDTVDIVNVGNQLYGFNDVGLPKVAALSMICDNVGSKLNAIGRKFAETDGHVSKLPIGSIVIMAVDSMATRRMLDNAIPDDCFLIDGRMGAEKILIYTANSPDTRKSYAKTLYSDENAEQVPCTAKATSYSALTISGLIVGQVKSFIQGQRTIKNMSIDAATGSSIHFSH
jgi:molybdopterin/thiamine biosynthesis adenylyltransferase